MSDDLVQRLREEFLVDPSCSSGEAADRIERLEAALVDMVEAARTATDYSSTSIDLALQRTVERDEARAVNTKLREALHKVASESDQFGTWPHYHLHMIARAVLADIEEADDA